MAALRQRLLALLASLVFLQAVSLLPHLLAGGAHGREVPRVQLLVSACTTALIVSSACFSSTRHAAATLSIRQVVVFAGLLIAGALLLRFLWGQLTWSVVGAAQSLGYSLTQVIGPVRIASLVVLPMLSFGWAWLALEWSTTRRGGQTISVSQVGWGRAMLAPVFLAAGAMVGLELASMSAASWGSTLSSAFAEAPQGLAGVHAVLILLAAGAACAESAWLSKAQPWPSPLVLLPGSVLLGAAGLWLAGYATARVASTLHMQLVPSGDMEAAALGPLALLAALFIALWLGVAVAGLRSMRALWRPSVIGST